MAARRNQEFVADVKQFAKLTEAAMAKVARDSVQDVMEGAMTSARGVSVGGALIQGRIPVATGVLINSLSSEVKGRGISFGDTSYTVALAGYELGDVLSSSGLDGEGGGTGSSESNSMPCPFSLA